MQSLKANDIMDLLNLGRRGNFKDPPKGKHPQINFKVIFLGSIFFYSDQLIHQQAGIGFSAAKAAQEAQMSVRPFVRPSGYFNFDSL